MKKIKTVTIIFLICTAFYGCLREHSTDSLAVKLTLKAELPEGFEGLNLTEVRVQMISKSGAIYRQTLDENGIAIFDAQSGPYRIVLSGRAFDDSLGRLNIVGGVDEFMLLPEGILESGGTFSPLQKTAKLNIAMASPLIIREIYWAGCEALNLGGTYAFDQYVEVYNNSQNTVYLDSLFIGTLAPANSSVPINAWAGMDTIGLFSNVFMVPGNGRTHPLAPGEGAVFATNAVDHSRLASSGLRLDKAHFALYHPDFTHFSVSAPAPGVVTLQRIGVAQGTAHSWSVSSPAFVIFRIPDLQEWRTNTSRWRKFQPGLSSGILYWHIHKDWILDGVECITRPTALNLSKRQPITVDASYTWLRRGQYQGNVVRRKIEEILPDGRIVYQDTNNSEEDFETDVPPNPALRP